MTKRRYHFIAVLFSVIVITVAVFAFYKSDYRTKPLQDVVTVDPQEVTEVSLNSPYLNTGFHSTTDPQKINILIHYLKDTGYQRLNNDQSSYMPTRAAMIYLYENDKTDFLIPYEKEVMINHKVYRVKNQDIDNQFLQDFYLSLEE